MKRTIERPWGTRKNGGWIFNRYQLIEALKKAEVADISGIRVGTKNLIKVLALLPYEECLVKANNRHLEVETVQRFIRQTNGQRKTSFRKPKKNYNWFKLFEGAWIPRVYAYNVVIIKPRKF